MSFIRYLKGMKSRIDIAEYPRAWAEYNGRWYASWMIPLVLVACAVACHFQGWLMIAALVAYTFFYLRFVYWPCPRCGKQFTKADWRRIERSKRCLNCGLARGSIPTESKNVRA